MVIIADGTTLFLNTSSKTYEVLARGEKDRGSGAQDMLAEFLAVKDENAKDLGTEEVEGVMARKYQTKVGKPGEPGHGTGTLWVDPKSGFPVKVHFAAADGTGTTTFEKFRWNEKLDSKLFSIEPPEGYTPRNKPTAPPPIPPAKD